MVARSFFPRGLHPVLDGGIRDEDAMIAPQVPTGNLVGQAIFSDQADSSLLNTAGISAVGQGQIGEIDGKATATAEAAMARESDDQVNRAVGPSITEVVEGTRAQRIAAGALTTARAAPCGPVAAAPLDPRSGQVFNTRNALGDVGDILTRTSHRLLS